MGSIDHLFIVGAGFSHYAGLPLTTEFTEKLLDVAGFKADGPSALIVRFLQEFVRDAFDQKRGTAPKFWPHLEDIFTCIDLSANTGHHLGPDYSPSDLRTVRRALIVRIIRMLRQTYTKAKDRKSMDWQTLDTFFSAVNFENCAFLSMNWDTVIEEGLDRTQGVRNFDYGCDAEFARFTKSSIELASLKSSKKIQVIKPHGSANWLYCDICRKTFWFDPSATQRIANQLFKKTDWVIVEHRIGQKYEYKYNPRRCPSCSELGLGTRFATFSYRKAMDFPMYQRSWLTTERLLHEAKTWTFIGYSLPGADYEFKHLLKHVQLSRRRLPKLILITGGKGAADTQLIYQKFFGPQLGGASGAYFDQGLDSEAIAQLGTIGALKLT